MRLTTSGPPSRSTSSSDSTHSWISTDSNSETLTCPPLFIVSPSSVTFNAPTIPLLRGAKPGQSQKKRIYRRVRRPYIEESPIQNALVVARGFHNRHAFAGDTLRKFCSTEEINPRIASSLS